MSETPKNADPRLRPALPGGHALSRLIVAGALSAALFGSRIVRQEVESNPDMPGYETCRQAGVAWDQAMRHVRATLPDKWLHDAIRRMEAARF